MCKWCENYRFTINATSKKNLIDHGDFYVHANYCPVCGTLLNENLKNGNDSNKRFIIRVKPDVICIKSNAKEHEIPTEGKNYYCCASGLHKEEVVFSKKEEAYPFKTYFEAKSTADWFFNGEDYEIEEITVKKPLKKETETKTEEQVYIAKINSKFIKGSNPEECYYKGMSAFGNTPLLTDKDGAKYFASKLSLETEVEWFYNPEDYEIITTTRVVVEMPVKKTKTKLPHFTEEDFYLRSDSGSVIKSVYDRDTNKKYTFPHKTIDKINQVVDKLNNL